MYSNFAKWWCSPSEKLISFLFQDPDIRVLQSKLVNRQERDVRDEPLVEERIEIEEPA